ncbi:MAG: glycine cleavage system aminomethyltransferase GcvT [Chitinophagaceae bacterium]|nr:glycine cleavage system aminomethyltransferase GcvT [Oligoflexus sp.]
MTEIKKTPLHSLHKQLKAKMVNFGGWDMPVQYESVLAEHKYVREHCGIFDVSHMGEIIVEGKDALAYLQGITVNDVSRLELGHGQYSALPTEDAGFIDDLIIYRVGAERYFLCVNASNIEKDFEWLKKHKGEHTVTITNESPMWSQLAVQGPESEEALKAILSPSDQARVADLPYTNITEASFQGKKGFIARTGYTGEKGYEIYIPNAIASSVFAELLEKSNAKPIGLGARDTLRLEACYLLYGNDMDETVSPIEAGIAWAVRFEKGDFLGKAKMEAQKAGTLPARKMVAFKLSEEGIARHGMDVYVGDRKVGVVTSGSVLPTVEGAGGMALIEKDAAALGDDLSIDVRGKRKLAKVVKRPLYSAKVK